MKKGIYIRGLTVKNNAETMAKRCLDSGIGFAAFMIYWQGENSDKKINSKRLWEYSKVFSREGISPWVWGYPWCGKEEVFVNRLQWAKTICEGTLRGIIIDPELGYQGHRVGTIKASISAQKLVSSILEIMDENISIGVTSFGTAHVHRTFPWDDFNLGFGSPQFYTERRRLEIKKGIQRWKEAGFKELFPSVPTFGPNSGPLLLNYLNTIKSCADEVEIPITGWIFWSYQQTSDEEWEIISKL